MKKDISSLKKGDRIKILERPSYWSSHFFDKCPLRITFPTTIIIEKTEENHMGCDGRYGWDLEAINRAGWELLSERDEEEHFLGFI